MECFLQDQSVTEKYDAWIADGDRSFTAAGNMCGPTCCEIIKWVVEAWETLDRELIIRSLRSHVLTVAPDRSDPPLGNESDYLHSCHAGQERLASIQQALRASCIC